MRKKSKDIDIKNWTYPFFDDIINIKNVDLNKIKTYEKSHNNIRIYNIGYMTIKDSKYVKIYRVNPLYLIINKVDEYFEEINKNKYLTLFPTNESTEKIKKKYEVLWSKIKDLIRSIIENLDDYDEKHMKIKFNSNEELPPNKTIEIHNMITVVKAVFHENNKYYPQVF